MALQKSLRPLCKMIPILRPRSSVWVSYTRSKGRTRKRQHFFDRQSRTIRIMFKLM